MTKTQKGTWRCPLAFLLAPLCLSPDVKAQTAAPPSAQANSAGAQRDQTPPRETWRTEAVRGAHAMVATDEDLGSAAGVEILKRGGNAVDAAVAVAFALAVVEPAAGNIGGGGFMMVRLADGHTSFFDYREIAPAEATRNMYIVADGKLDAEASVIGYKAVAVPGTVAGLELALKTYGTMKLLDVMAPAIRLAQDGFARVGRCGIDVELLRGRDRGCRAPPLQLRLRRCVPPANPFGKNRRRKFGREGRWFRAWSLLPRTYARYSRHRRVGGR
jgi:hypothetical protein